MTDDNYRPKRQATETQRAYLAGKRKQTKLWRSLWKTRPEYMEGCRVKATLAASLRTQAANRWIHEVVKDWPSILTPLELVSLAKQLPYVRKGHKRRMPHASLVRRLRSLGLLTFEPTKALWVNVCRFIAYHD